MSKRVLVLSLTADAVRKAEDLTRRLIQEGYERVFADQLFIEGSSGDITVEQLHLHEGYDVILAVFSLRGNQQVEKGFRPSVVFATLRNVAARRPRIGQKIVVVATSRNAFNLIPNDLASFRRLVVEKFVGRAFEELLDVLDLIRPPDPVEIAVPAFSGETTKGEDLLGIRDDATSIAALISSVSMSPPLALGVYGEWGSGKSFFMRTLEDEIRFLAARDGAFCRKVVSVWFNAWHYADGNLWASLVHQIFSSLHNAGPKPGQVLDQALMHVESLRETRSGAESNLHEAQLAVTRRQAQLAELQREQEEARVEAAEVTLRDAWAEVSADPNLKRQLSEAVGSLGLPGLGNSARELVEAAEQVRTIAGRARLLATAGRWYKSPLVLGLLVAVIIGVAGLVLSAVIDWSQSWLAPTVGAVSQLAAVASGVAAWITRQAGLARSLLAPAERVQRTLEHKRAEAEARIKQAEAVVRERLASAESALDRARQKLDCAVREEAGAQEKVAELTGPRLLERYLAERAQSGDYGKYLGVVSLVHRDLRDLDQYLRHSLATSDVEGGIDRIVLYIDDLDRCTPETVALVLEAVHLLLALPLFVVVVGVDGEWLAHSLEQVHPVLADSGDETSSASPGDYLDKIFQLTYRLPAMTPERSSSFLRAVAGAAQLASVEHANTEMSASIGVLEASERVPPMSRPMPREDVELDLIVSAMQLDEDELQAFDVVAPLVGVSPRRAKRFLNIYRVTKARVMVDAESRESLAGHVVELVIVVAMITSLSPVAGSALSKIEPSSELSIHDWLVGQRDVCDGRTRRRVDDLLAASAEVLERPVVSLVRWQRVANRFA
ncbi:P-loop NTPase fold protein [Streptomyces sp. MN03-5084-2B]|nr:P-loop NTPase fold protein [Streptomyces sp. MN03-5084-2B]